MSLLTKNSALRWLLRVSGLLLGLALLLSALASFLLSTQSGSAWATREIIAWLNARPNLSLSVAGIEGTLFRGMTLRDVNVSSDSGEAFLGELSTQWNPYSLLSGNLYLSSLNVDFLRAELQEAEGEFVLVFPEEDLLPVTLEIGEFKISSLERTQAGTRTAIDELSLSPVLQGKELMLSELSLTLAGIQADGVLKLTLEEYMPVEAALSWQYSSPSPLPYPEYEGELSLDGDLRDFLVEHRLSQPAAIVSRGRVIPGLIAEPFYFSLRHTIENLVLPAQTDQTFTVSDALIESSGNLDLMTASLEGELAAETMPTLQIQADASYYGSALNVTSYTVSTGESSLSGQAVMRWAETPSLEGSYVLNSPNPLDYLELDFPLDIGDLLVTGVFSLELVEDRILGELNLEEVSGLMGTYSVLGSGAVGFREESILLEGMKLSSLSNRFSLAGSVSQELDLEWEIEAPVLHEFLVDIQGELRGRGSIQGNIATPDLEGVLSGSKLEYGPLDIDNLRLTLGKNGDDVTGMARLDRASFVQGTIIEELSDLQLDLSGTMANHRIRLDTQSPYGPMELILEGGVDSSSAPNWRGGLSNATLSTPAGTWVSEDSSILSVASNGVSLGRSCWLQGEATLCVTLSPESSTEYSILASIQGYPLTVLNGSTIDTPRVGGLLFQFPELPNGSRVAGSVAGSLAATLGSSSSPQMTFELQSEDASFVIIPSATEDSATVDSDADEQVYDFERLGIRGEVESGEIDLALNSSFRRESLEDSDLDLFGEVTGSLTIAADEALSGRASLSLEDIRWIESLLPDLSNTSGAISSEISIAGSMDAPELVGNVSVTGASLSLRQLAISLSDVSLQIESTNTTSAEFSGVASSGAGEMSFEGSVLEPFSARRTVSARLLGDKFQLANLPDLQLEITPDLTIQADGNRFDIQGTLLLPTLAMALQRIPESSLDVSRDVVIVNYPPERPDLARADTAVNTILFDIPVSADVNISLGDNVSFRGFGLETQLGGNLEVSQTLSGGNMTYGELSVTSGKYEIYGRALEIRQGTLLFFGAYDNPAIDIRAVREVENQTVGVLMNGTMKNMRSQLFSTPALSDNDIIAVMVTGRPFSQVGAQDEDALLGSIARLGLERGQGLTNQVRDKLGLDSLAIENTGNINNSVLTIGKYLTPEIFIRYGIGLFDSQPKLAIDYLLSDKMKLKAESGEYQSVDITYTVEN